MIDLLSSAVCSNLHTPEYSLPPLKRAEGVRLIIGLAMLLFFFDNLPHGRSHEMPLSQSQVVQSQN